MATATGKAARKHGGNRYDVKRSNRNTKHEKRFANNALTPDAYRKMKLSEKKALSERK
jgi:hypothetical protein